MLHSGTVIRIKGVLYMILKHKHPNKDDQSELNVNSIGWHINISENQSCPLIIINFLINLCLASKNQLNVDSWLCSENDKLLFLKTLVTNSSGCKPCQKARFEWDLVFFFASSSLWRFMGVSLVPSVLKRTGWCFSQHFRQATVSSYPYFIPRDHDSHFTND